MENKPTINFTTVEHSHINFIQEVSYTILLNSINNILREEHGRDINSVLEDLAEGMAGTDSKLTIQELASILLGEIKEIFTDGQEG